MLRLFVLLLTAAAAAPPAGQLRAGPRLARGEDEQLRRAERRRAVVSWLSTSFSNEIKSLKSIFQRDQA